MIVQPKQSDPTAADLSNEAATAGQPFHAASIAVDYATPASGAPDQPAIRGVGDEVLGTAVSQLLTGGTELTIVPPEDPEQTYRAFRLSPFLQPILDAFAANVYAAGFSLQGVIDTERPDARRMVRDHLHYLAASSQGSFDAQVPVVDEVIDTELSRIRARIVNEMQFLRAWFARACPGSTYRAVKRLVGYDMEIQGDGYVEVLRDSRGFPAKLVWAPAWSIRAKPTDETLVQTPTAVQVSDFAWAHEVQLRRFRGFVQVDLGGIIIARYKEYGDPRVMSRKTGRYYLSLDQLYQVQDEWTQGTDGQIYAPQVATELLQFSIPNPLSATHGKPGHTGIYPNLEGGRDLEEENQSLIVDRKVPQMFILVAGGAGIPKKEIESLQNDIQTNAKEGRRSIYVLQAKSAKNASGTVSPTPTLEIVKTKSEQYQDALGLQYLEHCEVITRHAYRLPRAALGQHENVTRDEALAGYRFAESQTYDPRRDIYDDRMNSTLLIDLGVQLTRYKTSSRLPKEPTELASIISTLMSAGVLTPDEGRLLAGDVFQRDFPDLIGIWSKLPTKLLLAMLQTKNQLVAAALLGSETESDIIERLQAALVGQLDAGAAIGGTGEGKPFARLLSAHEPPKGTKSDVE